MNKTSPFRQLELQLQLKDIEEKWEAVKKEYENDKQSEETIDEILKITVEKIKILAEINMNTYKA